MKPSRELLEPPRRKLLLILKRNLHSSKSSPTLRPAKTLMLPCQSSSEEKARLKRKQSPPTRQPSVLTVAPPPLRSPQPSLPPRRPQRDILPLRSRLRWKKIRRLLLLCSPRRPPKSRRTPETPSPLLQLSPGRSSLPYKSSLPSSKPVMQQPTQ